MTIRIATPEDLETVKGFLDRLNEYEIESVAPRGRLSGYAGTHHGSVRCKKYVERREDTIAFLKDVDGTSVGFMALKLDREEYIYHRRGLTLVTIEFIYLEEGFRGQGYGTQMVAFAKDWALAQGANQMQVGCMARNKENRTFYEKCGFAPEVIEYEMEIA